MYLIIQSCLTLCDSMDCNLPGSSVHGVLQQEYWSELPFLLLRDLPDPGVKPSPPVSLIEPSGIKIYALLNIKQIVNATQPRGLSSTLCNNLYGKRIQKRINLCLCLTESGCCTPKTQHCKSTAFQYQIKILKISPVAM